MQCSGECSAAVQYSAVQCCAITSAVQHAVASAVQCSAVASAVLRVCCFASLLTVTGRRPLRCSHVCTAHPVLLLTVLLLTVLLLTLYCCSLTTDQCTAAHCTAAHHVLLHTLYYCSLYYCSPPYCSALPLYWQCTALPLYCTPQPPVLSTVHCPAHTLMPHSSAILHFTALYCTALHCTALHCTDPQAAAAARGSLGVSS